MKFILVAATLISSLSAFAYEEPRYCENQFEKYCECTKDWNSYSLQLVTVDLKNNTEKRRNIGSSLYGGDRAKEVCQAEMDKYSICR